VYIVVVEDERGALISEHALHQGELTLGRTPENDVVLSSHTVSRKHARLFLDGPTLRIADLGSANGVVVDERLIREPTVIDEGNQVRIGEYRLFVERATGRLKPVQDGISTAIVHPEQAHGKLVVVSGPQAGREHLLFEPIVAIGRTDENDVTIADVSVSRHHGRLKRHDDGGYTLSDLGSSNGTLVNGRRVSSGRVMPGDRVQFGNVECLLVDPQGRGKARRTRQYVTYGLAVLGAALVGALMSLLLRS
jgi:pSer/pThr/pTyr-binding forkhead associated (FHA) protein